MALETVADYIAAARMLLQDQVQEYRYPDSDLVLSLNMGLLEARRLRPDLFLARGGIVPSYDEIDIDATVEIDQQYRAALTYYICGHTQLQDQEDTQDARATVFMNKFTAQMLVVQS